MDKSTELDLLEQSIRNCTSCSLHHDKYDPVPMHGPARPKVAVIGHGPNKHELKNGLPWSGKLGYYTRNILENVGIHASDVAWMNVVCCGDSPKQEHIDACRLNCRRQLQALSAPYTLVLGSVAVSALLPFRVTLSEIRGIWWKVQTGKWAMATYHPSSTMHGYSANQEAVIRRDLERFSKSVNLGSLYAPKLSEKCLRCEKWPSHFVQGIAFCNQHVPTRLRREKGYEQLNLLGEL